MNQQRPTSNSLFEAVIVFGPGWTELEDVETESKIPQKVMKNLFMKHLPYIFKDCWPKESQISGIATLIFLKDRMDQGDNDLRGLQLNQDHRFPAFQGHRDFRGFPRVFVLERNCIRFMDEFARTKNPLVTKMLLRNMRERICCTWFLGSLYMFGLLLASGFSLEMNQLSSSFYPLSQDRTLQWGQRNVVPLIACQAAKLSQLHHCRWLAIALAHQNRVWISWRNSCKRPNDVTTGGAAWLHGLCQEPWIHT